jgi:hypothetical protein
VRCEADAWVGRCARLAHDACRIEQRLAPHPPAAARGPRRRLCLCRIVSTISSGEHQPDAAALCTNVGLSDSNPIAMSQSGQFVLKVEQGMLVVYEWSGSGMSVTWKRRCQLTAPDGYSFRTSECIESEGLRRCPRARETGNGGGAVGDAALDSTMRAPSTFCALSRSTRVSVRATTHPHQPANTHTHTHAHAHTPQLRALSASWRSAPSVSSLRQGLTLARWRRPSRWPCSSTTWT